MTQNGHAPSRPPAGARSIAIGCVLAGLLLALTAGAEPPAAVPNPRVRDGSWVTDLPGALSPATRASLDSLLTGLERDTEAEVGVAVVSSLDGLTVEEYATQLFEAWGIGKRGQDNGVLFLWSSGDRRVRIEVGYGLESVITDGRSGSILDRYVTPEFKAGAYDRGVLQGVEAIAALIRRQPVELPSPATTLYEEPQSSASRALRVVPWALGGAFSAVGALFGFGRWRRRRPRRCPNCRAAMKRLREAEDDEYLEAVKQLEERIGSVDYDVWKCAACAGRMVLRYPRWFSRYRPCPQCGNRTCSSNAVTQVAATTSGSGLEEVTEVCAFCNFRHVFTRTIPRISASSSSSGSLSSSGSSSSSFGGGSSGGGGSSRGY